MFNVIAEFPTCSGINPFLFLSVVPFSSLLFSLSLSLFDFEIYLLLLCVWVDDSGCPSSSSLSFSDDSVPQINL